MQHNDNTGYDSRLLKQLIKELVTYDGFITKHMQETKSFLEDKSIDIDKELREQILSFENEFIRNMLSVKNIIVSELPYTDMIRAIINKPLVETTRDEVYILKALVQPIETMPFQKSLNPSAITLGKAIHFLIGTDSMNKTVLGNIAGNQSLAQLCKSAMKHHIAKRYSSDSLLRNSSDGKATKENKINISVAAAIETLSPALFLRLDKNAGKAPEPNRHQQKRR